jgi:hypothetical protein
LCFRRRRQSGTTRPTIDKANPAWDRVIRFVIRKTLKKFYKLKVKGYQKDEIYMIKKK